MNKKGGIGGYLLLLILFFAITFVAMIFSGNISEIPIIWTISMPTMFIGVFFLVIALLLSGNSFFLGVGLGIIAHYYWVIGL